MEMDPRRVLPFAVFGGRYEHVADPVETLATPRIVLPLIEPVQPTREGRTGLPPEVTRTVAATRAPAVGFAGVILGAPSVTPSLTATVSEVSLSDGLASGADISVIVALNV